MKNNQVELTSDELAEILSLNNEYQEILISLGQINLRRDSIEKEEAALKITESEHYNSYDETQKKEANFKQRIVRKYGEGEINLESGVYTKSKK